MSSTGSDSSDSSNSKDSSSDDESSQEETDEFRPQVPRWYDVSKDPKYSDMSDHSSDNDPYEERSSDEEKFEELSENLRDPSEWCSCGECALVTNAGTELFCCCDIERVEVMKGDRKCITLTDDFNELILNKKVLHLVSYSVNKNGCIKEKETEKFNKMLRYTGYKSFLNILDLNGLGKKRRYGLPACVVNRIRARYPSLKNDYTGFKAVVDVGEGGQGGSQTLRAF